MIKKLLKSLTVFLVILGIFFSNMPFDALTFLIDSYQKTSGIVDKIWLVEQNHNSDVVDKFISLRNISDKLRIHEARASTFVAVSNYNSAGSASALVNKPAGTVDNDIMFAVVMRNTAAAPTTVPAGWALLGSHVNGVYQQRLYWKLAAGEGASYIWAWAASAKTAITIAAYRGGFDTANPIDVVSNTEFVTTPNTTVRAASMNVTAPNSSLFWFGTIYSTTVRTWTKPSIPTTGWVENYDGGAATSDFSRTIDSIVWAGFGATGNMDGTVVTGGTTVKHAFAVALKPPPSANNPPALTVSQPDGIGDTVNVGDIYNITYSLSDAEDVVTAAFYYDTDGVGLNGTAITGACAAAPEGTNATCSWNTTGMTLGSYYVYGITNDGVNPQVSDYSPGMIAINAAAPDATSVTYQVGGDGARSGYSATITGSNFGTVAAGASRANCVGGAGTGCVRFVVGGNATVAYADVTAWSNTSITFTVNANLASYGGLASLQVVSASNADTTPLDFYIYPNILFAPASGQIGDLITISGDHFGAAAGEITINTKTATVGTWGETSLSNIKIPGQEGAANITGKIQLTRSDGKTSNQYPAGNFTILAPSVSGSNPVSATMDQTLTIEFSGLGIDTDTGTAPTLKLTKTGQTDITGVSYAKITDYQTVSASFNLTGAATGYWKLVIINMDTQSGSYGNETTTGFYISALAPVVTGINPDFGLNSGIANITSISGNNFQSGATAKLTRGVSTINQASAFTYNAGNGNLENGSFDLTGQTPDQWWNVVVTNLDSQSGSYGDESTFGFQIRSAKPSTPANLIQSKTEGGASIAVGDGIGGQTTVWFGMDMAGGLTAEQYFPQVEVKPVGAAFECNNASLTPCTVTSGFFAEGSGVMFNGTAVQGWANIFGTDGALYHWQARVRNSAGTSNWVSFGGNNDPNDRDVYIDNTPPAISPGTDGTCNTAAINITDLGAVIIWNTTDATSGALTPPGAGAYATAQVQYIKTSQFTDWLSTPGSLSPLTPAPRANSPHQIELAGLAPSVSYTYRMRSKDAVDNEGLSSNCTFATTSTRPIKTVEFFIGQETTQNIGTQIAKSFSVYIPESPGAEISVKSAMIEISGVSSASPSKIINVELRRDNGLFVSPGTDYTIDSTGTTTPFAILFDALNPNIGEGNENMADDIISGATQYDYTLYINGGTPAEPVSAFSAKLIITYSYVL